MFYATADDVFDVEVPENCKQSKVGAFVDTELKFHAENKTLERLNAPLGVLEQFLAPNGSGQPSDEIHNSILFLSRVFDEAEQAMDNSQLEKNGWTIELCEERERQNLSPTLLYVWEFDFFLNKLKTVFWTPTAKVFYSFLAVNT